MSILTYWLGGRGGSTPYPLPLSLVAEHQGYTCSLAEVSLYFLLYQIYLITFASKVM